jgi:hypothetical protein
LSKLPIKYLRIWLHSKKSNKNAWLALINIFQHKFDSWKGKFLSMGGSLVMLNYVLSALLLYYLFIYRIPKWVVVKINRLRRSFLWAGMKMIYIRKYILISWGAICLYKEHGSMRVLNLDQMNIIFLFKWIWNYFHVAYSGLWKLVIQIKYKGRFSGNLSFFWKHVCHLIPYMCLCMKKVVGNG